MMILQATGDLRKVSLWLGHADMQTTEVYLRADPTDKLEAIKAITQPALKRGRFTPPPLKKRTHFCSRKRTLNMRTLL